MSAISKPAMGVSSKAFVVPAGENRLNNVLDVFGTQVSVKISSRDTHGAFDVCENTIPPHSGPPLHLHYVQDEWWYIVEGEFLFEVDGEQIHAGPGGTVFAAKGTRHTFQNIGETEGHTVVTVVPGGLDLFFEDVYHTVQPGDEPDPAVLLRCSRNMASNCWVRR